MRYNNIKESVTKKMVREFPQILIYSVRSLEAKVLFFKKRLNMSMNLANIEVFKYNFNEKIRPRGEMLLKTLTPYNDEKLVEFMRYSDEEFSEKIGVSL